MAPSLIAEYLSLRTVPSCKVVSTAPCGARYENPRNTSERDAGGCEAAALELAGAVDEVCPKATDALSPSAHPVSKTRPRKFIGLPCMRLSLRTTFNCCRNASRSQAFAGIMRHRELLSKNFRVIEIITASQAPGRNFSTCCLNLFLGTFDVPKR